MDGKPAGVNISGVILDGEIPGKRIDGRFPGVNMIGVKADGASNAASADSTAEGEMIDIYEGTEEA